MSMGFMTDLDFEKRWAELPTDADKLKFVAAQAYKSSQLFVEYKTQLIDHEKRIGELEKVPTNNAKWAGAKAGGTVTGIASFFAMVLYFAGKFLKWWD